MKPSVVNPNGESLLRCRIDYWKLAKWAISDGLITKDEAYGIARVGSRKEVYWNRHLQDLIDIVDNRERIRNAVHI